ncbi:hypothetical protein SLS59_001252 [Nothophoma quercina]|uniref:U4/U6.U5 small nuclear ribonucleoprotein 27kDa protein domain-containing protein n=1 Tax=Nothophoma quercina TaxID=749835 RepID=A0ABR3RZG4_9PLEO
MEDFDENDEMAAMMGFSSFGGTKKRKFDQTNSPKAKDEYSASGANSTELGVRTKGSSNEQQSGVDNTDASSTAQFEAKPPPPASGLASFLARGQALPEKPPNTLQHRQQNTLQDDSAASEQVSFGGPSISRAELNVLKFGVKTETGDTAYFLPSFVEDPWERMTSTTRN